MSDDRVSDSADTIATIRATLDVLVVAPLTLGAQLVDDTPAAIARARQELSNARFIGQLTVGQGVAEIQRRLVNPEPRRPTSRARTEDSPSDEPASQTGVPAVSELALPDYEHLPAIDIVAKLPNLTAGERDAIERYEQAHRRRRTVLGKLEQLAEAE